VRSGGCDAESVTAPVDLYRGHRFPADVISQVVWLYFRFSVSYREVEEMMARRGIQLTVVPKILSPIS
jgi:transposase-like protein